MIPRQAPRFLARLTHAALLAGAFSFLVLGFAPRALAASAAVDSGGVVPAEPTICDSVSLFLRGSFPNSCYSVVSFRVGDPQELPTAGPVPVYRIRAVVRAELSNSNACATVITPYRVSKELGRLPFGFYHVEAVEYIHPYPASSTSPIDSSNLYFNFSVAAGADSCQAVAGCAQLGFGATGFEGPRVDGCTARTQPGERVCFDVTLQNWVPVGGLQTEVEFVERAFPWTIPVNPFVPVAVIATPRAAGFTVNWTADGHRAKIVLFSPTGASIPPGRGAVLHVCYTVNPEVPAGVYPIRFGQTVVASPTGGGIALCPTFAETRGQICVGQSHCDLNGDGIGDIRDIVRQARCILAHGNDACPDSVYEAADCNEDGSTDIRDIVCCVRDILAHDGGWGGSSEPPSGSDGTSIGFEMGPSWTNETTGFATLGIFAGGTFGGLQFVLNSDAARVKDISLQDDFGRRDLLWSPTPDGRGARVMIFERPLLIGTNGGGPTGRSGAIGSSMRLNVTFEPIGASSGTMGISGLRGATTDGSSLGVQGVTTTVEMPANAAMAAAPVLRARPNPFLSATDVTYSLKTAARATLRLYDVNGRLVRTLHDGATDAGVHVARWDGRDDRGRASGVGIYFIRLSVGSVVRTERILRLR